MYILGFELLYLKKYINAIFILATISLITFKLNFKVNIFPLYQWNLEYNNLNNFDKNANYLEGIKNHLII